MKYILPVMLIFIWGLASFLTAFEEEAVIGTWVRDLPQQSDRNGQYRYHALSFWQDKTGELAYLDFRIYPHLNIRSNMTKGRAKFMGKGRIQLDVREQIRVYNDGKGLPTPFHVEKIATGATRSFTFALQEHSKLQLNDRVFLNYRQQWSKALKEKDEKLGMDLFMINIYLLNNQLEYFGSPKMMRYKKFLLKAPIRGSAVLDFEARGFIGLGNSGLHFSLKQFEQLAGSALDGSFFGGANRMEGSLSLFLGKELFFEVDFRNIKVSKGHPDTGSYLVNFPGYSPKSIPVSYYGY